MAEWYTGGGDEASHASCLPNECNVIDLITKKHLRPPCEAVVKFSQSCLISHYLLHNCIIRKWKTCNSVLHLIRSSRIMVSKRHTGRSREHILSAIHPAVGKKKVFLPPSWSRIMNALFHGRLKQNRLSPTFPEKCTSWSAGMIERNGTEMKLGAAMLRLLLPLRPFPARTSCQSPESRQCNLSTHTGLDPLQLFRKVMWNWIPAQGRSATPNGFAYSGVDWRLYKAGFHK